MKQFQALFLTACGVALIAGPVALMIDHLGRGAAPLQAAAVLPIWIISTALFALPFAMAGAGVALGLLRLGGDRWSGGGGRLLFSLLCSGLGAAMVIFIFESLAAIAAASGAVAAWLALSPSWPPRWRYTLIVTAGLAAGLIAGLRTY